ncbi:stage V sporulation protein R [Haloarcula vallismortis]|uniref:Stage V sporulation protein R-like protein n=2 Tax=Haloarcula vallismortis TaxID=28442 RepID=M0JFS8_HALVA|nr:SpoVR family protein [Haloarcula vallismortis]EMA07851.1 stage V sporulation protein R-like protein [Haloarcula vallismortis ATCC 29715]SDX32246.1 stage V sporulation protein R [Haloarcula vallismortis]
MNNDRFAKQRVADDLDEPVEEAGNLARKLGLKPYPVNYWIVDYDEMNELIAYGGFQQRYPHWRWGMQYDRQQKQGQFLGGKAFEIVNNDDPAHAFLQESNTLADQKAVITHVEAHADFFANNEWFRMFTDGSSRTTTDESGTNRRRGPDAAGMLARHGDTIQEYMQDPDIERAEVERFIDHVLCLEDNIDQHVPYSPVETVPEEFEDIEGADVTEQLDDLDLSEEVKRQVFDDEWLDAQRDDDENVTFPAEPEKDVLGFLRKHGMQYDADAKRATEMEDWQTELLELLRREAYYFAPQKMTKIMNEGWASYWESLMMTGEQFAGDDEFILYSDHMSKVLGSGGLNPYSLGLEIWEYVENTENRREVIERLLRVEGITWRNFDESVDYEMVQSRLEPPEWLTDVPGHLDDLDPEDPRVDSEGLAAARGGEFDVEQYPWKVLTYEGLAHRHYSLVKPQYRGFVSRIGQEELERTARYMFDDSRYDSVEEALADVDYTRGWERMREIRESHNDVTFLDEFLTQEFVDDNDYFTYEYTHASGDYRVTSTDHEDVKKKLMLQFTNFGKPTVVVEDGNYQNRNELLLAHQYNGVMLDIGQAKEVLKRTFELWGRPVNLLTIVKEFDDHDVEVAKRRDREPEPEEVGKRIRYDGDEVTVTDVDWSEVEHLTATDIDYNTKPDEWLA